MATATNTQRKPQIGKGPMRGRGMPVPKGMIKKGTMGRLLKTVVKYYKWQLIVVAIAIVLSSVGSLVSSVYMKLLVDDVITPALGSVGGLSAEIQGRLIGLIIMMVVAYTLVTLCSFLYTRIGATVTQGMLYHFREDMFAKMQTLPIRQQ